MSATTPPPSGAAGGAGAPPSPAPTPATARPGEACPLCGAPLHPEQEWCLTCGAAARTRLAASPGWRGPIVGLVVVLVLSLGVLAGSLVKLAGGSPAAATQTTTVTTAATAAAPTATLPSATATTATTATTPTTTQSGSQTGADSTTATTTSTTGAPSSQTKGGFGIDRSKLKQSVAERLRKLGLNGK